MTAPIRTAIWERVWRALQALPRDASDGERATAALHAVDEIGPREVSISVGLVSAFAIGLVLGAFSVKMFGGVG